MPPPTAATVEYVLNSLHFSQRRHGVQVMLRIRANLSQSARNINLVSLPKKAPTHRVAGAPRSSPEVFSVRILSASMLQLALDVLLRAN